MGLRAAKPGQRETVADLDSFDGLDPHQCRREPAVEPLLLGRVRAEPGRNTAGANLHHPADRVAVGPCFVDPTPRDPRVAYPSLDLDRRPVREKCLGRRSPLPRPRAVWRALARSRASRVSASPNLSAPARSAWPGTRNRDRPSSPCPSPRPRAARGSSPTAQFSWSRLRDDEGERRAQRAAMAKAGEDFDPVLLDPLPGAASVALLTATEVGVYRVAVEGETGRQAAQDRDQRRPVRLTCCCQAGGSPPANPRWLMPRSRACGCTMWHAWAAPARLRPAEPASTAPALRRVGPSPMLPASASVRLDAPDAPARAPQSAISWHHPSAPSASPRQVRASRSRAQTTPRPGRPTLRARRSPSPSARTRCGGRLGIGEIDERLPRPPAPCRTLLRSEVALTTRSASVDVRRPIAAPRELTCLRVVPIGEWAAAAPPSPSTTGSSKLPSVPARPRPSSLAWSSSFADDQRVHGQLVRADEPRDVELVRSGHVRAGEPELPPARAPRPESSLGLDLQRNVRPVQRPRAAKAAFCMRGRERRRRPGFRSARRGVSGR